MKILVWNVRGLNNPFKQREIRKMLRRLKISLFCLVETCVKFDKADAIKEFLVPGWDWFHNYSTHYLGRIWICWDLNALSISLISIHEQAISCRDTIQGRGPWMFSGIYGSINGMDRRRLWRELDTVQASVGTCPWLVAGDFNVIRSHDEKWGKAGFSCYEMDFIGCINRLEIDDLAFTGMLHTWSNKQVGEDFVSKKLDKVVSNLDWLSSFVNTSVDFLEGGVSDHSPTLILVEYVNFGPKPFKFFNFWADYPQLLDWIK
jgi:hypothetical protein